ncbi:phage holin family protein [Brevundimonas sp.]|uniref:phage holin family protein n=1 Tax=Brevundimonas sp. TaxID=1871086 RepID=UPI002D3170BB|nr:phage holin family protein [Brevundimonas sp.]HYD29183.1 phage holin family protein [Brevundimonas sp.]
MDRMTLLTEAAPILPGVLGRWLYHFDQVRHGRRPAIGWLLAVETMIAIPMGFIGQGVADMSGMTGRPAFAFAIGVAFLGPRVLDLVFTRWAEARAAAKETKS